MQSFDDINNNKLQESDDFLLDEEDWEEEFPDDRDAFGVESFTYEGDLPEDDDIENEIEDEMSESFPEGLSDDEDDFVNDISEESFDAGEYDFNEDDIEDEVSESFPEGLDDEDAEFSEEDLEGLDESLIQIEKKNLRESKAGNIISKWIELARDEEDPKEFLLNNGTEISMDLGWGGKNSEEAGLAAWDFYSHSEQLTESNSNEFTEYDEEAVGEARDKIFYWLDNNFDADLDAVCESYEEFWLWVNKIKQNFPTFSKDFISESFESYLNHAEDYLPLDLDESAYVNEFLNYLKEGKGKNNEYARKQYEEKRKAAGKETPKQRAAIENRKLNAEQKKIAASNAKDKKELAASKKRKNLVTPKK
jgi:hypothetical protein